MNKFIFFVLSIIFVLLSFIFIPLSFETTLRVVDKYDRYFFLSKRELTNQYSIPKQIISGILELKLRSDWRRHFTKSIEDRISSDIDAIQITLKEINSLVINQGELMHPPINQSTFNFFLRGYGWCDQVNTILTFAIDKFVDKAEVFATFNIKDNESHHTVSRIKSYELGIVFIDVWVQNNEYFSFSKLLTKEGKIIVPLHKEIMVENTNNKSWPDYPLMEAHNYKNGYVLNQFSFMYQIKKAFSRIIQIISNINLASTVLQISSAHADSLKTLEVPRSQEKEYLKARLYHIYGKKFEAKNIYKKLLGCDAYICKASNIFYKRLSHL